MRSSETIDGQISQAAILEVEKQLMEAMKRSDVPALDKLLHDDLLFITPDGQTITKEMDLAAHRSGAMIVEELKPEVEQVHLIGDTAIATIVMDTKGTMLGQPIEGRFRYIRFWKLSGDQWQVIGGSCTRLKQH